MKLEKLEAVRGAAAVYVVLHHTISYDVEWMGLNLGILLRFGQEAVITFFLLSGFVIAYSFNRSTNRSFGSYFANRFCRIYIPLMMVFAVTWLFSSQKAGRLVDPDLFGLLGNISMLQDMTVHLPGAIFSPYLDNGPLWSLSYEWWFYMLFFPLVTYVNGPQHHYIAFGLASVAAVVYLFMPVFPIRVLMHLAIWWAGAYLAVLYLDNSHYNIRKLLLPMCALGFITITMGLNVWWYVQENGQLPGFLPHPVNEFRHFVFALFVVPAGLIWIRLGAPLYRWLLRPFAVFAPISYGIYICHYPVMRDASYLEFIGNPILEWLLYFLIMLLLSALIERVLYPPLKSRIRWMIAGTTAMLSKTITRQLLN